MQKILVGLVLTLTAAALSLWFLAEQSSNSQPEVIAPSLNDPVAEALVQAWRADEPAPEWMSRADAVYLAARRRGVRLAHGWGLGKSGLQDVVQRVRTEIAVTGHPENVDTLELVLASQFENLNPGRRDWSTNIHRGIHGFELRHGEIVERYSPTYMLATNRDTRRLIELFKHRHKLSDKQMRSEVIYRQFRAEQWLIHLGETPRVIRMERGNEYVPVEAVSQASTQEMGRRATQWMRNNLHADGRMTYKYWPSARSESVANNMIRQWMATIALIRAARHWNDEELMRRAADNIDYNLRQFYHEQDGYGLIEWQGKVKLGAVALAALALVEHADAARWSQQEAALRRTTDTLWHEDGSFTTFFKPKGRNDIQNFYPGEALLYWAFLYERDREPQRLQRILKSFEYYRDWHLQPNNRNPAFIPWHTQAYYKVWQLEKNEALSDFIFTMNDWLVGEMQQWEVEVVYRDTLGRFYNPKRPYGPPHVSSTGVYLEGLIDAFAMAREMGDLRRSEQYRLAIVRGLRSVMQLQFVDDVDMFYVPVARRDRVYGGMRTTVYNNEIRCDNVQHNLMAILKILQEFTNSDFDHGFNSGRNVDSG